MGMRFENRFDGCKQYSSAHVIGGPDVSGSERRQVTLQRCEL